MISTGTGCIAVQRYDDPKAVRTENSYEDVGQFTDVLEPETTRFTPQSRKRTAFGVQQIRCRLTIVPAHATRRGALPRATLSQFQHRALPTRVALYSYLIPPRRTGGCVYHGTCFAQLTLADK